MDDDLLDDIALVLMTETVSAGASLSLPARQALERVMQKVDVTLAFSRAATTQRAISLRLRELLCPDS